MEQNPGELLYSLIKFDIRFVEEQIKIYTGKNDDIVSILNTIKHGLEHSLRLYKEKLRGERNENHW